MLSAQNNSYVNMATLRGQTLTPSSNPPLPLDCVIGADLALTLLWGPELTDHRSQTPEKDNHPEVKNGQISIMYP